jgi:iron complex outermembrane receptor protein
MLIASSFLPPAISAQEGAAEPRDARRHIEEIVVQARRRDELLGETPVSVTALSNATLRETGVTRLDQIQDLVPNLSFYTGRSGLTTAVFIRGVGQVDPIITFDPGVGIYVDGVFLARAAGSVLDIVDPQQIEVLRGPQGTLFGKNTVGGAITVTTTPPGEELAAEVRVGGGSFDSVWSRFTLNSPVAFGDIDDRLFTRLTFATEYSKGYTKNTFRDRYANDTDAINVLSSWRLVVTDDIEVNVSGNWFRDHTSNKGGRCVVVNDPPLLAGALPPDFLDECAESRAYRFRADTPGLSDIQSYGVWGNINWNIGALGFLDDLSLKSISSWREQRPRIREDGDMTEFLVLQLSGVGGSGEFVGKPSFQRQYSTELQVNGVALDEKLNFVSGVYGFWEDATEFQTIISLPMLPAAANSNTDAEVDIDNWSWALFGQATYDPTDWLSLTAGVRFTQEKKGFKKLQTNAILDDVLPLVNAAERKIFDDWTPMASIALHAPDGWLEPLQVDKSMLYFTYSRGFKSGGFNGNARGGSAEELDDYDPETLDSFELGWKSSAFDRRLTLNTSFFLSKYDDIQVSIIAPGGSALAELRVLNAAKATIMGAEFELEARPIDNLLIAGSIGLLDTEYDDFGKGCDELSEEEAAAKECPPNNKEVGPIDRTGESFNNVPDFESRLTLRYDWELPWEMPAWAAGALTPRLDYSYRSSVHYQGPELKEAIQRGYNLLNFFLSYSFNEDRSQLSFWAKNLTDEQYFQQNQPTANTLGTIIRYYQPPRAFGGEVSHRFGG